MTARTFTFTVTESRTELEMLAGSLAAGQSSSGPTITELPYSYYAYVGNVYKHKWHWDATRKRAWWIAQTQATSYNQVYIGNYNAITNTWGAHAAPATIYARGTASRYQGHMYSATAYDEAAGEGYWLPANLNPVDPTYGASAKWLMRRTRFDSQDPLLWVEPASSDYDALMPIVNPTAGAPWPLLVYSGVNGIAWHPGYGTSGGLFVTTHKGIGAWNKATNTWAPLFTGTADMWSNGRCVDYCAGMGCVVIASMSNRAYRVDASGTATALPNTPIPVGPMQRTGYGILTADPTSGGTALILERDQADTTGAGLNRRAWKLRADYSTWDQIGNHPFYASNDGDSWSVAPITAPSGAMLWGIQSQYGVKFRNTFWRPY